jgi:hypothetical protein
MQAKNDLVLKELNIFSIPILIGISFWVPLFIGTSNSFLTNRYKFEVSPRDSAASSP